MLILSMRDEHYRILKMIPAVESPITFVGRTKDGYPIFGIQIKDLHPGCCGILYSGALMPKNGIYPETSGEVVELPRSAARGRVLISDAKVVCNFRHLPVGRACARLAKRQNLNVRF